MIGLGLAAGAVLHPLQAQVIDTSRVRPDTAKIRIPVPPHADSLTRRDSTGLPHAIPLPAPQDTMQPALAHAPVPTLFSSERSLHFTRAEVFATGALSLQDLLERVSIATPISTGYLASPSVGTVAGDARRVRVFIDGIEYDALDPRSNGIIDLSQVPLWTAEDVSIERSAVEVRVHIRTWRVDRTDAYTRTDIGTGDQQLNAYRAYFGNRSRNGAAIQLGAQQYGTAPPSYLGSSSDQLALMARVGWAAEDFKVDGNLVRLSRSRGDVRAFSRIDSLRGVESRRTLGYLRVGYRDPDTSAVWFQAVGSTTNYNFKASGIAAADTIKRDTTASQLQALIGAGTKRGPIRLSLSTRIRHSDSTMFFTPVATASYALGGFGVRANAEGESVDSLSRADVVGEALFGFTRVGGAVDRISDHRAGSDGLATLGTRAWAGIRIREVWLDAGVIRRDSTTLVAPTIIGAIGDMGASAATGLTAAIEGRVWRSLRANIFAVRWSDTASVYRPQYQTRSELFIRTTLPDRFPTGNFAFLLSGRHEYRSASLIPDGTGGFLRAQGENAFSTLLEIRIYGAIMSWQLRNVAGLRNYQAADYQRPRTANFYGVRWEFWN